MQMNMMCARREFKNAQQRFDHMTMVIKSYDKNRELLSLEDRSYLEERKGNPFAVMYFLSRSIDARMAGAWLFNKDLKSFKKCHFLITELFL